MYLTVLTQYYSTSCICRSTTTSSYINVLYTSQIEKRQIKT